MKRMVSVFVVAVVFIFTGSAFAAGKIAVLDANLVMNESNAAKRLLEDFNKEREAAKAKIEKLETPLLQKQKRLEDQRSVLGQDEFLEQQSELRREIRQYKAEAQSIQEELDRKFLKYRQEIADSMKTIVNDIATQKGYDIVLPKNILFYNSDAVDITADVLKKVNT